MLEAQEKDAETNDQDGAEPDEEPVSQSEATAEDGTAGRVEEPVSDGETDAELVVEELSELEKAAAERDRALAEKAELFDRYQRAQAEFDNLRKRLVREKEEAVNYAAMETIRSLLPIADDFERALASEGLDEEVRKGLALVNKSMFDVFNRAGLKPVEEDGTFDPYIHHAVDKQAAKGDEEDQQILEVYQRGYRFKDRLLRPALVKVAVRE